jgi:hypothetical protein
MTQVHLSQANTLPSNTPQADATPTEPGTPIIATSLPDATPIPAPETPDDGASNNGSYTSTLPDVFDVEMDDSAPPATGPWMVIDHFTGKVIDDDNQTAPPQPVLNIPTTLTIPTGPSLAGVEVAVTPHLGTAYLVETPPSLLSEDEDVRPQWLITAVNRFLRFVPYVGSLGKVVDLYLAQEAKLGYPNLVCMHAFSSMNCILNDPSLHAFHFRLTTGPLKSPRL